MKIRLLILSIMAISLSLSGQNNELVYLKFIPLLPNGPLEPFPDSLGYFQPNFSDSYESIQPDMGIFEEVIINDVYDGRLYRNSVAIYDTDFNFSGSFFYLKSGTVPNYPIQITPGSFPEIYLFFPSLNAPDVAKIFTPWGSFLPGENIYSLMLKVNPVDELVEPLFKIYSHDMLSSGGQHPFTGFVPAATGNNLTTFRYNKNNAIVNDNFMIVYLNIGTESAVLTSGDTTMVENWNDQVNLWRLMFNLNTGQLINADQIGSEVGSVMSFSLCTTEDMTGIYRTGLVRGNNTPISITGQEITMAENDSLYCVFITKEDAEGNTQWVTELYSYNNFNGDTIPETVEPSFRAIHVFDGIIEKENHLFVNNLHKMISIATDTLLYKDFSGQTDIYPADIPIMNNNDVNIMYSEKSIFKLDNAGHVVGKLSHKNKLATYEITISPTTGGEQKQIYEIGDKIAWINHFAENENQGEFIFTHPNGIKDTTIVDLPLGKGAYILWLDTDLNILDQWIFPFQGNLTGVQLKSIHHLEGDTLLIQGRLFKQTNANLDPFGESPNFSTQISGTFYAVYAAPDILSATKEVKKNLSMTVYPNPVKSTLNISGMEENDFKYFVSDVSGKQVMYGNSSSKQIDINRLKPGMYFITINTKTGKKTTKFVVE